MDSSFCSVGALLEEPRPLQLREEVPQRVDGDDGRGGEPGRERVDRLPDSACHVGPHVGLLHEVEALAAVVVDVDGEARPVGRAPRRPQLVLHHVVLDEPASVGGVEGDGLERGPGGVPEASGPSREPGDPAKPGSPGSWLQILCSPLPSDRAARRSRRPCRARAPPRSSTTTSPARR